MAMVPVFVPPQPTRRARRLAEELQQTIAAFRRKEPGLRDSELRQALQLAARRSAQGQGRTAVAATAVAVALLLLGALVFLRQSGAPEPGNDASSLWQTPAVVVGIILVALAILLKMRR